MAKLAVFKANRTDDREPHKRRLDSIARLINGAEICTSVCFDGQSIIIANNSGHETDLQHLYIEFFRKCANTTSRTEEINQEAELLVQMSLGAARNPDTRVGRIKKAIQELSTGRTADTKLLEQVATDLDAEDPKKAQLMTFLTRPTHASDAAEALLAYYNEVINKSVATLAERLDADKEKVLSSFFDRNPDNQFIPTREAFKKNNISIVIVRNNVHAEMKVLDYLVRTHKINLTSTSHTAPPPIYVGVSKLCCLNCAAAVLALNSSLKANIVRDVEEELEEPGTAAAQSSPALGAHTPQSVFQTGSPGEPRTIARAAQSYLVGGAHTPRASEDEDMGTPATAARATAYQQHTPQSNNTSKVLDFDDDDFAETRTARAAPVTPFTRKTSALHQESPIQTRGSHLQKTENWTAPSFLKAGTPLEQKYNEELAALLSFAISQNSRSPKVLPERTARTAPPPPFSFDFGTSRVPVGGVLVEKKAKNGKTHASEEAPPVAVAVTAPKATPEGASPAKVATRQPQRELS